MSRKESIIRMMGIVITLTVFAGLIIGFAYLVTLARNNNASPSNPTTPGDVTTLPAPATTLPPINKKDLTNIPFYSQAPLGVWDALHEDACEEASVLMLYYWQKDIRPTLEEHDQNIRNFVAWEEDHNYSISLNTPDLAQAAQTYLNFKLNVTAVSSANDIIKLLTNKSPVIIPADGKKLTNPHYSNGGPIYHMLIITGYDSTTDQFITQDPGTKFGANFRFSSQNILDSLGNWSGSGVTNTDRRILFLEQ